MIGGLGKVDYSEDNRILSPYSIEICEYDNHHNLIKHTFNNITSEYSYVDDKLVSETPHPEELLYDCMGNVIRIGDLNVTYDSFNRLAHISSDDLDIDYYYDSNGKRVAKIANREFESYLHIGNNEIGVIDKDGHIKELRIPGLSPHSDIVRSVAIETADGIYAPIHDHLGNIRLLVDIQSSEVLDFTQVGPFGENLPKHSPTCWIFSGKNYDAKTGLVYFGHRYYCPEIKQWLTPDPAYQTKNPYEYCLNNPLKYTDPDGQFAISLVSLAWGAGTILSSPLWAPYATAAALGTTAAYITYKGITYLKQKSEKNSPPYTWDDLGYDPKKCPGEGFKWRGKGEVGSKKGKWVKGDRKDKEELYPDLDHPNPIGPHWDYWGPDFPKGIRIKPDGNFEEK